MLKIPWSLVHWHKAISFSLYVWKARLSCFVPRDVLLKDSSKLYCQFCTMVQLFGLIVPRLCPKSLKDFRIKLCALRSRSKKVLKTEAQKGWSTLAKESQDNWSSRLYMIITVPSILSRISFLSYIVYILKDPWGRVAVFFKSCSHEIHNGSKPFQYSTTNDWNLLPKRQRSTDNLITFKSKIYVLSFLKQTKLTIRVRSKALLVD